MAEHLHIDYPVGGYVVCNQLLNEIDWDKPLDSFSPLEIVKTIGLITIMYDFPKLMTLTDGIIWS